MIDPKGDAESLVAYLKGQGRKARVLPLNAAAPGLLDPFSFGVDLAEKRTMATETLRLLLPRMSEERESAMIQAVGAVAGTDRPSLGKVVRYLEQADDPAWKNTGAVMRSISEMRLARLCFAPSIGQQIDAEGWTTVFTLAGLTLPDTTTNRDDYSYEQRLSVALLYLVSQFARKLLNGIDRAALKAIFLDEAWAITSTPEGAKLVPEVSRMGRSRNTALILVSQNAGDLLNEQVTNCLSSVFAFRSTERGEVANVMSLLGVAPSDEHKAALRALGNGECIFRDLDDRAGRIGIDLVSDELRDWIDTNPTRAMYGQADPRIHEPAHSGGRHAGGGSVVVTAKIHGVPPMAFSLALSRRHRVDSPSPCRHAISRAAQVMLIAGALLGAGGPALAATHSAPAPSQSQAQAQAQAQAQGRVPSTGRGPGKGPATATGTGTGTKAQQTTLTAFVAPALPGGICQVPGIGDIGGLVGLCSQGSSGLVGDLNNICEPSLPQPEPAAGGIDSMIEPPAAAAGGKTLYDNYALAGQFWAAHGLQCSDMTSLIGNNVAGMVFDAAKSLDRVTITVYQSAAGNNILTWLQNAVDKLITSLGKAIYFPFLAPVVILGAIWLAWQGLIRKRATRTIEGTLWMVIAATAAIALIGKPADFTGVGTTVANGTTGVLNSAFSKLPTPNSSNCLPVQAGDPQSVTSNYSFTTGNGLVDENADELWSVLVCKPWLWGELGTTAYTTGNGAPTVVNTYGRQLLWSQAIAANEKPTSALIQAKQATYSGIASSIQQNQPGIYPLFQGNQWTTRLEIAFAAMFAAVVAGGLILLIALTLIVLKLGFLLLLVAGPFFLIIGTHPGFGRVIAIRWFEMLVGVLLKQVAIAIVLSVLLYCYSLIMGQSDAALPWALKILMIALVSVAVFIYRKPFTHLFSAVGYGTIGSQERAEYSLREAGSTFRRSTLGAASVAIPGVAGYRAARWARRNPDLAAAAVAGGVAGGVTVAAATGPGRRTGSNIGRRVPVQVPPRGPAPGGRDRRRQPGRPQAGQRGRGRRRPYQEPAGGRRRHPPRPAARPAAAGWPGCRRGGERRERDLRLVARRGPVYGRRHPSQGHVPGSPHQRRRIGGHPRRVDRAGLGLAVGRLAGRGPAAAARRPPEADPRAAG